MRLKSQLTRLVAVPLAVAAACFACTGLSLADGYQRQASVVADKAVDWSGVYFGAHSGMAWSQIDSTFASGRSFSVDHDPQLFGGHIGLQHQFGQIVVGVEGSFTAALRDTWEATPCPNALVDCGARFDDVISVGPRIGWATGKWMPYLTGGYASVGVAQRFTVAGTVAFLADSRERHEGWYIGGGLDWIVAPNWVVGLEYRHYELDNAFHAFHCTGAVPGAVAGVTTGCPQFAGAIANSTVTDASLDTVTLRVSWKFGRSEPDVRPLK